MKRLGGLVSDLVADLWAFSTEHETGHLKAVRQQQVLATLDAIQRIVTAPTGPEECGQTDGPGRYVKILGVG